MRTSPARGDPGVILLANVVVTCKYNLKRLDLPTIAWDLWGGYNPMKFSTVQLRVEDPRSTALVFTSGQLVCTGAACEQTAKLAVYLFTRMLWRSAHPTLRVRAIEVQLLVATTHCGAPVRLDALNRRHPLHSLFKSDEFPGLRIDRPSDKKKKKELKVLVFSQGAVVLTGGRTREQLVTAWRHNLQLFRPFLGAAPAGGEEAGEDAALVEKAVRRLSRPAGLVG